MLIRIIKNGIIGFWRNRWISLASVFTITLALFIIGSLIFFNILLNTTINRIAEKIDISVYFNDSTGEKEINEIQQSLLGLAEVRMVEYLPKEKALDDFKNRHYQNALITRSLEEIGVNPLQSVLNIKAKDFSQYESISRFLTNESFKPFIAKVNYFQNKTIIEKLSWILNFSRRAGVIVSFILAFIAALVSFNTIRLAIYNSRDEIKVMRFVGAANSYIRGPFIIEGIMVGALSGIIAVLIFFPLAFWTKEGIQTFFGSLNVFEFHLYNFFWFGLIILAIGVFLGAVSSAVAIRRYLSA